MSRWYIVINDYSSLVWKCYNEIWFWRQTADLSLDPLLLWTQPWMMDSILYTFFHFT